MNGTAGLAGSWGSDHPRFIMQYRRKRVDEYLERYLGAFTA